MRRILYIVGLLIAGIIIGRLVGSDIFAQGSNSQVGRFQLITRQVTEEDQQLIQLEELLYRIDTVTGKVWKFEEDEAMQKGDMDISPEEFKKLQAWQKNKI